MTRRVAYFTCYFTSQLLNLPPHTMTRYQIFHTCLPFLNCPVFQVKMLRLSYIFFIVFFIFVISSYYDLNTFVTSPSPSFLILNSFTKPWYKQNPWYKQKHIIDRQFPSFKTFVIFKILVISIIFIFLLFMIFLHLCITVRYVTFSTNLSLHRNNKTIPMLTQSLLILLSLSLFGFLSAESPENCLPVILILPGLEYECIYMFIVALKFRKRLFHILFAILSIYILHLATTFSACILCLLIFQNWCHSLPQNSPQWLQILPIILSNDIHQNPGPPFHNNFFNVMLWNVNSIAKDNFHRVRLIEAHNSLFNYHLISICKTSLNDSIKLPDILLTDYTFVHSKNPANTRHGGVGLFYKNSLPVKIRYDLCFDESIVVELKFGRKKIFFTVLYRSPASNYTSPEFMAFLSNVSNLYTKINNENPYASFFTGDFNGHSQFWWPDGDTTAEGREIENLISSLGLSQLISEPTNFDPNKNPSCIDLVITGPPNLVLDSGTRASLDSFCHHQITYCRVNFNLPPPHPLLKKRCGIITRLTQSFLRKM